MLDTDIQGLHPGDDLGQVNLLGKDHAGRAFIMQQVSRSYELIPWPPFE